MDSIKGEKALKQQFVVKPASALVAAYPTLQVCSPPWGGEALCADHLRKTRRQGTPVVLGCPKCWNESKAWASVDVWGMRHNFDFAVQDRRSGETMVLEAKMFTRATSPNGEIQRFLGQLLFARSKHHIVIGLCGRKEEANMGLFADTQRATAWCRDLGLELVFVPDR